jgi:hypothetical protein
LGVEEQDLWTGALRVMRKTAPGEDRRRRRTARDPDADWRALLRAAGKRIDMLGHC